MISILERTAKSKKASFSLKIISHASTLICVIAYLGMLVFSFLKDKGALPMLIVGAGVPFVLVSIARRLIDAPRPYELYDFYPRRPKDKHGASFPSRHVFSAFVIGTLAFSCSVPLGIAVSVLGITLSVSRVLLGIHFVRDCVAGALIGVLSGVLSILLF